VSQLAERTMRRKWNVESITNLKKDGRQFMIEVNWAEDEDGPTWEPFAIMCEDIPEIVKDFVENKVPDGSKHLVPAVKKLRVYRKIIAASEGGGVL